MPLTLTQEDLKDIMAQVEADLDQVLKSEASSSSSSSSSMSKDEESGASPDVSASPAESSGSEGGDGAPPVDGGDVSGAPPDVSGAPPAGSPPGGDPAASAGAPPGAPGMGAPEESLSGKLAAMPPDQLRHLYMEVKAALFQQLGSGQDPAAAGAAPAQASPSASASPGMPPAGAPPAFKAEGDPDDLASDGKVAVKGAALKQDVFAAAKAEGDPDNLASDGKKAVKGASLKQDVFAAAKKSEQEIADLKEQIAGLYKAVELVMGQPMRKAITGISQLPKSAVQDVSGLSKSEITSKLKDLDYAKLTKKDRDAINGFYDGRTEANKLSYLFATK